MILKIFFLFFLSIITARLVGCNYIVNENKKVGLKNWWIDQADDEPGPAGFTTKFSVEPGQYLYFKVSTSANGYDLAIIRLGYYNGSGATLYESIRTTADQDNATDFIQPQCNLDSTTRMVDCSNWRVTSRWLVPRDAVSGVYVAVVKSFPEGLMGNYIPFVVRKSSGALGSDLLFKTSDLTWVAYNKFGNWNLYRGNGSFTFDSRAKKVSYNRPFSNRLPRLKGGQHQNFLFGTEFPMIYWLEKHGYDVSYGSCADVEVWGTSNLLAGRYKVLLSVGHDEYWTPMLRKAYEDARENGVHLAFFSGNELFWRVRWQDETTAMSPTISTAGVDIENHSDRHRIVICYKETIEGTALFAESDWTGTFIDPRFRPPEPPHALTGQYFLVNAPVNYSMEVPATDGALRFWRHTELSTLASSPLPSKYTSTPGILGYELDVFIDDCYRPPGMFSLSNTTLNFSRSLMEEWGASYKGSGVVSHRLSMYRYVSAYPPALQAEGAAHSAVGAQAAAASEAVVVSPARRLRTLQLASSASVEGKEGKGIAAMTGSKIGDFEAIFHKENGGLEAMLGEGRSLSAAVTSMHKDDSNALQNEPGAGKGSRGAAHRSRRGSKRGGGGGGRGGGGGGGGGGGFGDDLESGRSSRTDRVVESSALSFPVRVRSDHIVDESKVHAQDRKHSSSSSSSRSDSRGSKTKSGGKSRDTKVTHTGSIGHINQRATAAVPPATVSSLVFGAGTIQWAWALSDWHDGDRPPVDRNLQQATVNLFADMGVQPAALDTTSTNPALVQSQASCDYVAPVSTILYPRHRQHVVANRRGVIVIRGTAYDRGGGQVAGVEISLDGGVSWSMASGRERWVFRYNIYDPVARCRHMGSEGNNGTEAGGLSSWIAGMSQAGGSTSSSMLSHATAAAVVVQPHAQSKPIVNMESFPPKVSSKLSHSAAREFFVIHLREDVDNTHPLSQTPEKLQELRILSRAVDDSGWLEESMPLRQSGYHD